MQEKLTELKGKIENIITGDQDSFLVIKRTSRQ